MRRLLGFWRGGEVLFGVLEDVGETRVGVEGLEIGVGVDGLNGGGRKAAVDGLAQQGESVVGLIVVGGEASEIEKRRSGIGMFAAELDFEIGAGELLGFRIFAFDTENGGQAVGNRERGGMFRPGDFAAEAESIALQFFGVG
jgi:hypothetical protein